MEMVPGSRPAWYPLPRSWRAHAIAVPGTVLLETAGGEREDHVSYLFTNPQQILTADTASAFAHLLKTVDAAVSRGLYVAGAVAYEAGLALQHVATRFQLGRLASFGIYGEPMRFDHSTGFVSGPSVELVSAPDSFSAAGLLCNGQTRIDRDQYSRHFERIQQYLAAGDTYQVNFTTRFEAELNGSPLDLYERLIERQPVDYAAIVNLDGQLVLSFSPELFFRTRGSDIVTRPMKGTASRGHDAEEDRDRAAGLAADEKNRAEHVMIVDLLRNDLGRICEAGSVSVENLFRVETYTTLHQMTSEVAGRLRTGIQLSEIFRAIFPSGSITGAPKRRTMQIIDELEDGPRGVYTGAIGFAGPQGSCFNVPIRTLNMTGGTVQLGVGGGVVADSTADAEFREIELKYLFLSAATQPLEIIETMAWDGDAYPLRELHLDRLQRSAEKLKFPFDREIAELLLDGFTPSSDKSRVRVTFSEQGKTQIVSVPVTGRTERLRVRLAAKRILSTAPYLRYKTTHRAFYDREWKRAMDDCFDEVLFLNERDELAEGAISNIFVQLGNVLYTPPLSAGVLPGVLRTHLLTTRPDVREKTLRLEDLASADAAFVGNALRGLRLIGRLEFE